MSIDTGNGHHDKGRKAKFVLGVPIDEAALDVAARCRPSMISDPQNVVRKGYLAEAIAEYLKATTIPPVTITHAEGVQHGGTADSGA